ncbi:MAG: beta-galactosidase, partial [Pseudomonadales bacterium]
LAHGAECVCYFRWRQAPFAQEQMHAGILRVDHSKTEAWEQIEQVRDEVARLDLLNQNSEPALVAIITGAEGFWVSDIEHQGAAYDFNRVQFSWYSALREIGVNVDFVSVDADFSQYSIIIAPSLPIIDEAFVDKCARSNAIFIFGPRTGAKTEEFAYPLNLPPGPLQRIAPLRVLSVETLRADCTEEFSWRGESYKSVVWREQLEAAGAEILACYDDNEPAVVRYDRVIYMGTLTDAGFLRDFLKQQCTDAGIDVYHFGGDIRVRQRGELLFAFNYSGQEQELPLQEGATLLLGDKIIKPRDVTVWKN